MNTEPIKAVPLTLSPTDDTMAIAVRCWRRLSDDDRAALAGALGIVEAHDTSGRRPPIVVYADGARAVVITPWKPSPADFGSRDLPATFRGAMAVGGARWEAGRWQGKLSTVKAALRMLKTQAHGWRIIVVDDAAAADAAAAQARAELPTTLAIRRAKVTTAEGLSSLADAEPTETLADLEG